MSDRANITDREAVKFLAAEKRRRGDRTVGATATKIILERKREAELLERHSAAPDSKNQERSATAGRDVPAAPTPIGSDQSSTTPVAPPPSGTPPVKPDAGVSSVNEGSSPTVAR